MGIRGELYTEQVKVENRTYFFNVKENSKGDVFLQVVESKMNESSTFERHSIVIFESEMPTFLQNLDKCVEFIEKNKAKRFKEMMKRREAKKNREEASWKTRKDSSKENSFRDRPNKKRIIFKKKPTNKE